MLGAFVQAMQFVFEEKVMSMDDAAPPLLLIGMEGVWGTLICLFLLYPSKCCARRRLRHEASLNILEYSHDHMMHL